VNDDNLRMLERIASSVEPIAQEMRRVANHFDPPPPNVVDSRDVADRLGCTTTWVADMARSGRIPRSCVVPGTGNGQLRKFYRVKVDE
jgi:hypothetical protein